MLFHFKTNMAGFWPHHDNKPKKLTKKLTAPLKMESVTIIFSMFRLVTVEILSYGRRYPGFFFNQIAKTQQLKNSRTLKLKPKFAQKLKVPKLFPSFYHNKFNKY